jgi:DNA-binding response OmpR family regulator
VFPASLAALAQHCVDLVLLDYDLGNRETGFQFIRQAREAGYAGRIFLVTAGMSDGDYVRALGFGVSGYLFETQFARVA